MLDILESVGREISPIFNPPSKEEINFRKQ